MLFSLMSTYFDKLPIALNEPSFAFQQGKYGHYKQ